MSRFFMVAIVVLISASCTSCSSSDTSREGAGVTHSASKDNLKRPHNTKRVSAKDLMNQLASAGLETKDMGSPSISIDDSSRFPEEPRSTLWLRVSDGEGNATPMTFVEFSSWKAAAKLDAKPVNGFAVRNWFVLGTTNNYFVKRVTDALDT